MEFKDMVFLVFVIVGTGAVVLKQLGEMSIALELIFVVSAILYVVLSIISLTQKKEKS